jgi:protein-S-isoprenylcysteine O-methyltransferase Ste14
MNAMPAPPRDRNETNLSEDILKRFGQVVVVFAVQALILFLTAGRLNWLWAWLFLGICIVSISINATFLLRRSPETIAERGRIGQTKAWDKIVAGLWSVALFLAVPLVAGLDLRFNWTRELTPAYSIGGAVALAVGLGLGGWAMVTNAYFSTAVRIQSDRGQTVCHSGPYRFVRHPGYVGFILQPLGTPILLGSLWALIPGITAVALMVLRTSLEDRLLQAELPGYRDFVQQVRYRLLPGVW